MSSLRGTTYFSDKSKDAHDANSIPFSPIVIQMMDHFYTQEKTHLIVYFHSGVDITKGDTEKAKMFTRYNYDCKQRKRQLVAAKKVSKDMDAGNAAEVDTLLYFKDVIQVSKIHQRALFLTENDPTPFQAFHFAFTNGVYGCRLEGLVHFQFLY